jgi:hypothetical protein
METKLSATYRLSKECKRLIAALSAKLAISYTSVIELAVRAMAKKEKVD